VENILETITYACTLEQNSTKIGISRFVTVSQVEGKVVSEMLRKYVFVCVCVCEVGWYLWQQHAKAYNHETWRWNFLCKLGAQNKKLCKI